MLVLALVSKVTLTRLERLCFTAALFMLLLFVFGKAKAYWVAEQVNDVSGALPNITSTTHDLSKSYWSDIRKQKYARLALVTDKKPVGVLTIEGISINVPIFEGVSDEELDLGVGRVPGTGTLKGQGNLVIAGHRDSFFRHLGQLSPGQTIEVSTLKGQQTVYEITGHTITTPDDTAIMNDGRDDELTLVTCYPFYFVGSAPQRYIIKAKRI
ncbi:class D sortase [Thalassotalea euphylliae]|uniref:class D sortase n=1 Tax=Thalassotalea euphylliae TaxID=1655234 RepID=UPI003645F32A